MHFAGKGKRYVLIHYHDPIRVLATMTICSEEMERFRPIDEVRENFSVLDVLVGMMIKVPSTAFALPEFAGLADFLRAGSRDLLHYFLAVDRDNTSATSFSLDERGISPAPRTAR